MESNVIITITICVTLVVLTAITKVAAVMSAKYDYENIIKSESEEK